MSMRGEVDLQLVAAISSAVALIASVISVAASIAALLAGDGTVREPDPRPPACACVDHDGGMATRPDRADGAERVVRPAKGEGASGRIR